MTSTKIRVSTRTTMRVFDSYLLKNLAIATFFIAVVLTLIIFLTQSLKFLEIVLNAGSSGSAFWILTSLALPRFFEIILPLALLSATLFLYNKMTIDSELVAMRAIGHSSFALAKPAITLGIIITTILWGITMWVAPKSLAQMQLMRSAIKADMSSSFFREGVFNTFGNGLTVYIKQKNKDGSLSGLMIHDRRDKSKPPSTVLAKYGMIISGDKGQQVVVFNGARHEFSSKSGILQKLAFERYTIDLPSSKQVNNRWVEPDERTIFELLNPNFNDQRDLENAQKFTIEIHRRITSPLLAMAFPLIGLCMLLLGPVNRRGHTKKIAIAILVAVLLQSLYLSVYNIAAKHHIGLILMYFITVSPIALCIFMLSGASEQLRRKILYKPRKITEGTT